MKRQAKPQLLSPILSSDSEEVDLKKVVHDSSSDESDSNSAEEQGESEQFDQSEGGESEIDENDSEESEMSEEALMNFNQKHVENAENKFVRSVENSIPYL